MPRGLNRLTSMCRASGVCDMKSKIRAGSWRKVIGSGLQGVDDVGELDRVADEEHREVVADEVPVAVLGVELHREAARVARRLGRVATAREGGEAHGDLRLLPGLLQQLGPRELADRLVAPGAVGLELAV